MTYEWENYPNDEDNGDYKPQYNFTTQFRWRCSGCLKSPIDPTELEQVKRMLCVNCLSNPLY